MKIYVADAKGGTEQMHKVPYLRIIKSSEVCVSAWSNTINIIKIKTEKETMRRKAYLAVFTKPQIIVEKSEALCKALMLVLKSKSKG